MTPVKTPLQPPLKSTPPPQKPRGAEKPTPVVASLWTKLGKMLHTVLRHMTIRSFKNRMSLQEYQTARGIVYTAIFLYVLIGHTALKITIRWLGDVCTHIYMFCFLILAAYMFILIVSINVLRLHDIGRSGYWVLSPIFFIYKFFMGIDEEEGEPGSNQWGVNPTEQALSAGQNILPCPDDVRNLYMHATRQNNSSASYELGRRYFYGCGIVKSPLLAMRWLVKAANAGNPEALQFIATLTTSTPNKTTI